MCVCLGAVVVVVVGVVCVVDAVGVVVLVAHGDDAV